MTGPTTQEYQPLSQALRFQSQQPDLPRLQLAPPEHQKQLQLQAQHKEGQEQQPQSSTSPTDQRPDAHATSISSSREVSPAVGVETSHTSSGQKRKSAPSKGANTKKRRTDPVPEQLIHDLTIQYGLGTHYPYAYSYPGAPPPPIHPGFHQQPPQTLDMSFNEFQWRLLNLCGEFYEAATELIRSTPHLVLSQAFQVLDRGTGLDPISVLNDARRTCDMLLTNPQALSVAPPPPTALPLPALTSLAHLNSRPNASSAPAPAPVPPPTITPPYYSSQPNSMVVEVFNPKVKEKDRPLNNVQGTWKDHEIEKLKALAEKHRIYDKSVVAEEEEEEAPTAEGGEESAEGENSPKVPKKLKTSEVSEIDWDKVVEEFGDERSRHQVLIKATYLGLKPSSSLPGKKPKRKKTASTASLPPPLTFSSASAKSIPTGYNPHIGNGQRSSTPPGASSISAGMIHSKYAASTSGDDPHKGHLVPPLPTPPQHHPHAPAPYGQTGWYPHPQNPYYAYHQPMYYSPHPQGYGMQGYGMQAPPPPGYYPSPYVMPPGSESPPPENQPQAKGKRKESRKDKTSAAAPANSTPVPPPSLPPKLSSADISSAKSAPASSTAGTSKPVDAPASGASTPQTASIPPPAGTPTGTGSSGVLRRGPNNSLFTYTPLPHGPGNVSTEQPKEA